MATKPKTASDYIEAGRITPNDLRKAKYSLEEFSYPDDLLSGDSGADHYGKNYVVFFINVSEDSKLVKNTSDGFIEDRSITPRRRSRILGRNAKYGVDKGSVAASAVGAGIISDIAVRTVGIPLGGVGIRGGALASAAVMATGDRIGSFTRPQKRLKTAIAMHVPNNLSIRYGIDWDTEETAFFSYATVGGAQFRDMIDSFKNFQGVKEKAIGVGNLAQDILAANVINASSGLSVSTGLNNNPMKEQIFNGVPHRSFQMDYQFFPRSKKESDNVQRIIQQFKYHAHPEFKDENNFIYIYPSEFDVAFYHGTEENTAIHRHTSCVLTNVIINYTPNGVFNTFADGSPTQINLTLDFIELARLSKDDIMEGF